MFSMTLKTRAWPLRSKRCIATTATFLLVKSTWRRETSWSKQLQTWKAETRHAAHVWNSIQDNHCSYHHGVIMLSHCSSHDPLLVSLPLHGGTAVITRLRMRRNCQDGDHNNLQHVNLEYLCFRVWQNEKFSPGEWLLYVNVSRILSGVMTWRVLVRVTQKRRN